MPLPLAAANQSWSYPAAGLVVRMRGTEAGNAIVSVCRQAGAETPASCAAGLDFDCNGLAGPADPVCSTLLAGQVRAIEPPRRAVRRPQRAQFKRSAARA